MVVDSVNFPGLFHLPGENMVWIIYIVYFRMYIPKKISVAPLKFYMIMDGIFV